MKIKVFLRRNLGKVGDQNMTTALLEHEGIVYHITTGIESSTEKQVKRVKEIIDAGIREDRERIAKALRDRAAKSMNYRSEGAFIQDAQMVEYENKRLHANGIKVEHWKATHVSPAEKLTNRLFGEVRRSARFYPTFVDYSTGIRPKDEPPFKVNRTVGPVEKQRTVTWSDIDVARAKKRDEEANKTRGAEASYVKFDELKDYKTQRSIFASESFQQAAIDDAANKVETTPWPTVDRIIALHRTTPKTPAFMGYTYEELAQIIAEHKERLAKSQQEQAEAKKKEEQALRDRLIKQAASLTWSNQRAAKTFGLHVSTNALVESFNTHFRELCKRHGIEHGPYIHHVPTF